jgi:phosphatidylglycerophosphate synthase
VAGHRFSWTDSRITVADALTGVRLVILPYLLYALVRPRPGLAAVTFAAMVATDLVDGRIARRLGQAREFGGAFDSTVDFVVIYSIFTVFSAVGLLPWWKWAVIFFPGLLMAWTQALQVRRARAVVFAPAPAGKAVGQIQYVYLPFLLARRFWWPAGWALTADHILFALLAAAIAVNTVAYALTLRRLLSSSPPRRAA